MGNIGKVVIKYGAPVNKATTFEVDKDVTIEGHKFTKGKYALFTIVPKDGGEVTVILNKEANQWGT